jgi:tRNA-Thr(GGU) m(6)t(6)A37 methyltransferase TsaA
MATVFDDIILHPIGVIRNTTKQPFLVASATGLTMQGDLAPTIEEVRESEDKISEVIINEELTELLDGIDDYSHIKILYWAHGVPKEGRSLKKVHPMGNPDYPLVGLFSTCSPARPNPILTTVVRLIEKEGNVLHVTGLDAIDGSPVLDIKPHVREFYPEGEVRIPEWMGRIQAEVRERK